MIIKKIKLENYRNYSNLELEFSEKINIFVGDNAQGKTNLLESIYVSSLGKSFQTSKDSELISIGKEYCKIYLDFFKDDEDRSIEIIIKKDGKKYIKIDGYPIKSLGELITHLNVVIFSPEDLKIIKDEPARRRNFIDKELCQLKLSYYDKLSSYKKIIKQRNKYLKDGKVDKNYINVLDEQLSKYGGYIIQERIKFIKNINEISKDIHSKVSGEKEVIDIIYESNIKLMENVEDQQNEFLRSLNNSIETDLYHRNTSKGPHKDDLKILINNMDARKYGSQGQQRTAALSLKLAEVELIKREKEDNPILLLDDVMSELDYDRQKFLLTTFLDIQLCLTTTAITDEVLSHMENANIIKIKGGELE